MNVDGRPIALLLECNLEWCISKRMSLSYERKDFIWGDGAKGLLSPYIYITIGSIGDVTGVKKIEARIQG